MVDAPATQPTEEELQALVVQYAEAFQTLRATLGLPLLSQEAPYTPAMGSEVLAAIGKGVSETATKYKDETAPADMERNQWVFRKYVDDLLGPEATPENRQSAYAVFAGAPPIVSFLDNVYVANRTYEGAMILRKIGGDPEQIGAEQAGAAIEARLEEIKNNIPLSFAEQKNRVSKESKLSGVLKDTYGMSDLAGVRALAEELKGFAAKGMYADPSVAATPSVPAPAGEPVAVAPVPETAQPAATAAPAAEAPEPAVESAQKDGASAAEAQWPEQSPDVTAAVLRIETALPDVIKVLKESAADGGKTPEFAAPGEADGHFDQKSWAAYQQAFQYLQEQIGSNPVVDYTPDIGAKIKSRVGAKINMDLATLKGGGVLDAVTGSSADEQKARAQKIEALESAKTTLSNLVQDLDFLHAQGALKPVEKVAPQVQVTAKETTVPQPEAPTPESSPAAQPSAETSVAPPPVSPAPAASVPETQTADPNVKALEETMALLGLNPGAADGVQDQDFKNAAGQLRTSILALGDTPLGDAQKAQGVTAADVAQMKTTIDAFKKGPEYGYLKDLVAGTVPADFAQKLSKDEISLLQSVLGEENVADRTRDILNQYARKDPEFAKKWNGIDPALQKNIPAVLSVLEKSDDMIGKMESVYGAVTDGGAVTPVSKTSAEPDISKNVRTVQRALGMLGDGLNNLIGQQSFINVTARDLGFEAPTVTGVMDDTTRDATHKAIMALKWGVLGAQGGAVDGTYNKAIGAKLKEKIMTGEGEVESTLREKLGISAMSKDDYKTREAKIQAALKAGKTLADAGGDNQLDLLIYSLDMINENGGLDNDNIGRRTTNANMMMDIAYSQFLSKMPWLTNWLKDMFCNSQIGKFMGTVFAARGFEVSRLWGEKPEKPIDFSGIKPEATKFYTDMVAQIRKENPALDQAGIHAKLREKIDEFKSGGTSGMAWYALKKVLPGTPEENEASVNKAINAAAAADPAQAANIFADSLVADAEAFRMNGQYRGTDQKPEAVQRDMEEMRKKYGYGPQADAAPTSAAAVAATTQPAVYHPGEDTAQAQPASYRQREVAAGGRPPVATGAGAQPSGSPEIVFEKSATGRHQLSVTEGSYKFVWQPSGEWNASIPESELTGLKSFMREAAPQLGLRVPPSAYEVPEGKMTVDFRLALQELNIKAQMDGGVPVEKLDSRFTAGNINRIQTYLSKNLGENTTSTGITTTESRIGHFATTLHSLADDGSLDQAMAGTQRDFRPDRRPGIANSPAAHLEAQEGQIVQYPYGYQGNPERYTQLPTLSPAGVGTLFGGKMGEWPKGNKEPPYHLTTLYERATHTRPPDGIKPGGYLLTFLDREADLVVTQKLDGQEWPTHYLINFKRDNIANPLDPLSPGRRLDFFLTTDANTPGKGHIKGYANMAVVLPSRSGPGFEIHDALAVFNGTVDAHRMDRMQGERAYVQQLNAMRRNSYPPGYFGRDTDDPGPPPGYGRGQYPYLDQEDSLPQGWPCDPKLQVSGPFSNVAGGPRFGFMNYVDNITVGLQRRINENAGDMGTCGPIGVLTPQDRLEERNRVMSTFPGWVGS